VYLLDTSLESSDSAITADIPRLYGGSSLTRLLQEFLLGVGGVRLLRLLGISPRIWHMNEGPSSFLTIELFREKVAGGMVYQDALAEVASETVFTTHTPVPAGLDIFEFDLITPYFEQMTKEIGITMQQFLDLGKQDLAGGAKFSMPRLAIRMS